MGISGFEGMFSAYFIYRVRRATCYMGTRSGTGSITSRASVIRAAPELDFEQTALNRDGWRLFYHHPSDSVQPETFIKNSFDSASEAGDGDDWRQ